jgi:hypothetical protein
MIIYKKEYSHPTVRPVPLQVAGVENPFVDITGIWKVKIDPSGNYWENAYDCSGWEDRPALDDLDYTLVLRREHPHFVYAYKKTIGIPADFEGRRIFLRFEGAFGFTTVYVDGRKAAYFEYGHVTWNCEITDYCTPGSPCAITISILDHADDMCGCFNHGGLKRPFQLMALPASHLTRLHVKTALDAQYRDAELTMLLGMDCAEGVHGEIALRLKDPEGNEVELDTGRVAFDSGCPEKEVKVGVKEPRKWDAEHPWLYTLCADVYADGVFVQRSERRFGFRQIERRGNLVFLNGKQLKVRGVSRHDISGRHGRYMTDEEIELEIRRIRQCNANYIRTSHYPPTESYMDICDKYGIYVEIEIFAFIARTLKFTNKMPSYSDRYVNFFAYELERDMSHPCLIVWGIANESFYGMNFAKVNEYMHKHDPGRLNKFSYPMTMQEEDDPVDLWSIHYINNYADMAKKHDNVNVGYQEGYDTPVLHDEFCHPPCYNRPEQMLDPAVRTFFGEESPERFWNNIWNTPGCFGGVIWAANDETPFFTPDKRVEWGIMDVWIRPKPEWWLVKKGFSPIDVNGDDLPCPGNAELPVELENRFNHTNLNEVTVNWQVGWERGSMKGCDLEPHCKGVIRLPKRNWKPGETVRLEFLDAFGWQVDEYELRIAHAPARLPEFSGPSPKIEDGHRVVGRDFEVTFSRETGLIEKAVRKGEVVICSGPYMNMVGMRLPAWRLIGFGIRGESDRAVVTIRGSYGHDVYVTFTLGIDAEGLISTDYTIDKLNARLPEPMSIRVSTDIGGLNEIGVYYILPGDVDTISWHRKSPYSGWPEDHISRAQGTAKRRNGGRDPAYGEWPTLPWSQDEKHYILYGQYDLGLRGTNDFRGQKHGIYHASAYAEKWSNQVDVESDGSVSLRMEILPEPKSLVGGDDPRVKFTGNWCRLYDGKNLSGFETCSNTKGDTCECTFYGTGIAWLGPVDEINGVARVYVDGELADSEIDQRLENVNFLGDSFGFEKKYGKQLFSVTGLPKGEHTLRIEVLDRVKIGNSSDACNTFISVDCFRVLGGGCEEDKVKMIVNNDYNYPRLAWGNYIKPAIVVGDGYSNRVYVRLSDKSDNVRNAI